MQNTSYLYIMLFDDNLQNIHKFMTVTSLKIQYELFSETDNII